MKRRGKWPQPDGASIDQHAVCLPINATIVVLEWVTNWPLALDAHDSSIGGPSRLLEVTANELLPNDKLLFQGNGMCRTA